MTNLLESSLNRISGDLPDFAPGQAYPVKLREGARLAGDILKKYVPDFTFDEESAVATVRDLDGWAQRNQGALRELMDSTANDLPSELQKQLGKTGVRNFLLAGYVTAVSGIGPWYSGKISEYATNQTMVGETMVNTEWAEADARGRLQVFGLIVKMENDGTMAQVFSDEGASGFGIPAVVVAIIAIAVVVLAAVVCGYLYLNKRLELNNKIMADICQRAMQENDKATVDKCLEASKELQQGPGDSFLGGLGKLALLVAGGYVAIKYVVPWATEKMGKKS